MSWKRTAWLGVGYGLLLCGLLTALNVVRVVRAGVTGGALPLWSYAMAVLASDGLAIVLATCGYVTLRRVRHPKSSFGANLDWGRVLGP